jgi:hypothetical protein
MWKTVATILCMTVFQGASSSIEPRKVPPRIRRSLMKQTLPHTLRKSIELKKNRNRKDVFSRDLSVLQTSRSSFTLSEIEAALFHHIDPPKPRNVTTLDYFEPFSKFFYSLPYCIAYSKIDRFNIAITLHLFDSTPT